MKPNKQLEEELNKQFPKGDKARGKALVINAIANIEIEKVRKELSDLKELMLKTINIFETTLKYKEGLKEVKKK